MYHLVYLKISLVLFAVWLIIFLLNKNQRRKMIIAGVLGGIIGPIQELWFTKNYWHPEYLGGWPWIEDIIFGFAIAGLAATLYEAIFSFKIREVKSRETHPILAASMFLLAGAGMGIFAPFMNSIYAAVLAFFLTWIITIFVRPDLFFPSIMSGLSILVLMFLGYQLVLFRWPGIINAWWELGKISGILIVGVPLEEYLWFFAAGLALGPIYEMWKGIKFVSM